MLIRPLSVTDAPFILTLLSEPSFIKNIGDRNLRTLDEAMNYLEKGPLESYRRFGFGLLLVQLKESKTPIGICGLIKRDTLDDVDLGFALLHEYSSKGYGYEAASQVLQNGIAEFSLKRVVAITNVGNNPSIKLLTKLGFHFEKIIELPPADNLALYALIVKQT